MGAELAFHSSHISAAHISAPVTIRAPLAAHFPSCAGEDIFS